MRKFTLMFAFLAFVGMTFAQNCALTKGGAPEKAKMNVQSKDYGEVIWSEDFNGDKWSSTVKSDQNGYILNTAAALPEGWVISETWEGATTNPDYGYFHWSDKGPRGVYTGWDDDDPFTPDQAMVDEMPDGATVANGFMMLESDFSNTTESGNMAGDPKDMDSYMQYGPIDFTNYPGAIFNIKTIYRYCCSASASFALELSSDYNPADQSGTWTVVPLNVLTKGNDYTNTKERDMHINVSKYVGGKAAVYFRIRQTLSSHYFWILDDISFYETPDNDVILKDAWAEYIYDVEEFAQSSNATSNFWGGYTEIPVSIVDKFVKFRAAVEGNGSADAQNTVMTVDIKKDGVVDATITSTPKTIWAYTNDTLKAAADYSPAVVGSYEVAMKVTMDAEDQNATDNEWSYAFEVTNSNRYARVRYGKESTYGDAGNRDWADGGFDGDACINTFNFPPAVETVKLKGISVFIDDYSGRDDEIEAIKNGQFSMIARIWKYDADLDDQVDAGIASNLYTVKIEDTATWVTLNFVDEGNLVVEADQYYAGIEIYTGNEELRFQIGKDAGAPKQPDGGGLVYLISQNGWYLTNDNYAITLLLDDGKTDVTFNVDMTDAGLAAGDVVYVTGSFANEPNDADGWDEPGTGESVMLTDVDGDMIYTATVGIEPGDFEYKYFKNAGWDNGDSYDTNRKLIVADASVTKNDIWGKPPVAVNEKTLAEVSMYPNPFNNTLTIENLDNATEILVNNVLGQNVLTISVTENSMELSTESLEKGIYLVTIVDANNNTRTEKVVKK